MAHGFAAINYTRNLRNSNMFDVKPKFKTIERFPKYHFQDLWNNICNNDLLSHTQSRKKFLKNLKESLLASITFVCNNPLCQECRQINFLYNFGIVLNLINPLIQKR